ncbi:MAG: YdeI/OmpD-associated family protein [Leadbetterella sp.]
MIKEEVLLVDREYTIAKFDGKGGWHYLLLEEDLRAYRKKMGWLKVKGRIDEYEFSGINLAPYGQGKSMFTVNASIRKVIKKGAGDKVWLTLVLDDEIYRVPEEIMEILEDYPQAKAFYVSLSESNQKVYAEWIMDAKTDETRVSRYNQMIDRLSENKKMYD